MHRPAALASSAISSRGADSSLFLPAWQRSFRRASMTASWRFGLHMERVIWSVCVVVRYCAFGCGGRAVDPLLYRSTHGHAQLLFAPV